MVLPGFVLAAGCILIGLLGASVVSSMAPLVSEVTGLSLRIVHTSLSEAAHSIAFVSYRRWGVDRYSDASRAWPDNRTSRPTGFHQCDVGLWLCRPSSRMQYTAIVLCPAVDGHFRFALADSPRSACAAWVCFRPRLVLLPKPPIRTRITFSSRSCALSAAAFRYFDQLQQGQVQLYILYIAVTLLLLLLWQLA